MLGQNYGGKPKRRFRSIDAPFDGNIYADWDERKEEIKRDFSDYGMVGSVGQVTINEQTWQLDFGVGDSGWAAIAVWFEKICVNKELIPRDWHGFPVYFEVLGPMKVPKYNSASISHYGDGHYGDGRWQRAVAEARYDGTIPF